jgi:hypothetical protein
MGMTGAVKKASRCMQNEWPSCIDMCSMSLAALLFEGGTTAHSLFGYPVEDETDVDNQNLATCDFKQEHSDFLHEVSVIFWDEFISNDQILMEAVLEEFKTRWVIPCYFIFVCAGDFAQVRSMIIYPVVILSCVGMTRCNSLSLAATSNCKGK